MTTWPLWGHVHPFLELARALRSGQHEIAFYCSESARAAIENEGFALFPFQQVSAAQFDRTLYSVQRRFSWKRPAGLKIQFHRWLLESVPGQIADLEAILAAWKPDLVITSETMWGPFLILREKHQLPVAVCATLAGCLLPGPEAPVWGIGLAPPRTWQTHLQVRLIEAGATAATFSLRRRASAIRQQHGLTPLRRSIRDLLAEVHLYLIRGAPEFDYQRHDLPPCVHYVGPLEWTGERGSARPAWLEGLARDKPVIYVSEGTLQEKAPVVLQSAAQGLANLDMQVILATGKNRDASQLDLGPRASNVRVEQWVLQYELMRKADVAISVGGCGTVLSALAAGVPVLVCPVETDQPDNARRVVETGVGISLPRKQCSPVTVRRAVERLLAVPSYRKNARQMAQVFARYQGSQRAADLVARLLKSQQHKVRVNLLAQERTSHWAAPGF